MYIDDRRLFPSYSVFVLQCSTPYCLKKHEIWSIDSQEKYQNCCQQMSVFKAKMHQVDFGWGSAPDPAGGA